MRVVRALFTRRYALVYNHDADTYLYIYLYVFWYVSVFRRAIMLGEVPPFPEHQQFADIRRDTGVSGLSPWCDMQRLRRAGADMRPAVALQAASTV